VRHLQLVEDLVVLVVLVVLAGHLNGPIIDFVVQYVIAKGKKWKMKIYFSILLAAVDILERVM